MLDLGRRDFITLLGGARVAGRGEGAAGREGPNHWVPGAKHAFRGQRMGRRVCAATARTRLGHRPDGQGHGGEPAEGRTPRACRTGHPNRCTSVDHLAVIACSF
jgi:hypothetical protein